MSNGITFLGYRYKIERNKVVLSYNKKTYKKIKKKLEFLEDTDLLKYYKSYASYYGYLNKARKHERRFTMKAIEKYEYYKKKYPKSMVLIKEGVFYKTYDIDAIILWHLFGYKWNQNSISFGSNSYSKVLEKLNQIGLSYCIVKDEDMIIEYSSEVYDLYMRLASIEYEKFCKKEELISLLKKTLNGNIGKYDEIKSFLLSLN